MRYPPFDALVLVWCVVTLVRDLSPLTPRTVLIIRAVLVALMLAGLIFVRGYLS